MTLAILLFSTFGLLSAPPATASGAQSQSASTAVEGRPQQQDQQTAAPAQGPPTSTTVPATTPEKGKKENPSAGPARSKKSRKSHRRSKRTTSSGCVSAPNSNAPTPGSSSSASGATNCPPSKVIVRQGGTSETSIQLAGPTSGTASHPAETAKQMLATTEANLKKISGQQLTANQKEMVNQIHQFMEQSKRAVGDGDLERARTLSWKAQVLSDELVKPPSK
jgi:hypothetical protein